MKKLKFTILSLAVLLTACTKTPHVTKFNGFALGTVYTVLIKGDVPDNVQHKMDSVFAIANNSMSVFNKESLLSQLNRNETDIIDSNIEYCIEVAHRVSEISGGKYDITILPLAEAYGFSGGRHTGNVNIDSLLAVVGYEKIAIRDGRLIKEHPGTRIDLNSIAKGYTVDMVSHMLEENGVTDYLVDIGGEIFCRGTNASDRPWTIGIETPIEGNYVQGSSIERRLSISEVGVATSGNYRNFRTDDNGRKYTHIIDPTTGLNTESSLLSATVIADNCTLADAYGTMFIALGYEDSIALLAEHPEIAALLIYADNEGQMKSHVSPAMLQYTLD